MRRKINKIVDLGNNCVAISLTQNKKAIIDSSDYKSVSVHTWWCMSYRKQFYVRGYANGVRTLLHRFIMKPKKEEKVDHVNGDVFDNRRSNLRICSQMENSRNKKKGKACKSKHKGLFTNWGKWSATICVNYKRIYLGRFNTEKKAAVAYNKAAIKYYGEFAKLNEV